MKARIANRVLIVEDNPKFRRLLIKILDNLNCVIVGETVVGEEAVRLFERNEPDVILLDIKMPQKDGLEILKKIRGRKPGQIVIMVTEIADQDIVQSCVLAGATGYILKTASANEIRDRIKKFIL